MTRINKSFDWAKLCQISPLQTGAAAWRPQIHYTALSALQLSPAQHPRKLLQIHAIMDLRSGFGISLHMMHTFKYLLSQQPQQLGDPRSIEQLCLIYNFLARGIPTSCLKTSQSLSCDPLRIFQISGAIFDHLLMKCDITRGVYTAAILGGGPNLRWVDAPQRDWR